MPPFTIPIQAGSKDIRMVELTGKQHVHPYPDGHVRIDCTCPYCNFNLPSLWLHFSASGNGNFMCKPCGSIGLASYEHESDGKRMVTLYLQGEIDNESWD